MPSLHYQSILPLYSIDGTLYPWQANSVSESTGSLVSTSRGLMGTQRGPQFGFGRVIHVVPGDHVDAVCLTLINPQGIGGYPSQVAAGGGTTIIVSHDVLVTVLIMDTRGRRIGVDPGTGLAVNDFGEDGYDSGPGGPRFLGIKNPAPGPYALQMVGTGAGAHIVNVYSVNLAQSSGNRIQSTALTSPGNARNLYVALGVDTSIAFLPLPVPPTFGSIQRAPNGSVTLGINNMPGVALTLQSSADLANWTTLASPTPATNPYSFTDAAASTETKRFYRAFYP